MKRTLQEELVDIRENITWLLYSVKEDGTAVSRRPDIAGIFEIYSKKLNVSTNYNENIIVYTSTN